MKKVRILLIMFISLLMPFGVKAITCEYTHRPLDVTSFYLKAEVSKMKNGSYMFVIDQNKSFIFVNGKSQTFKTLINGKFLTFANLNAYNSYNWQVMKDESCPEGLVYVETSKKLYYKIYFGNEATLDTNINTLLVENTGKFIKDLPYQKVLENSYKSNKNDTEEAKAKLKQSMDERVSSIESAKKDFLDYGCYDENTYKSTSKTVDGKKAKVWENYDKVKECENKLSKLNAVINGLNSDIEGNKVYNAYFDNTEYSNKLTSYQKDYESYKSLIENGKKTTTENTDDSKYNEGQEVSGCEVVPEVVRKWIKISLNFVKYAALILVIVLGTIDFIKAAASGEPDSMKKAGQSFIKRVVAVVILFLLPMLVELILNLINLYGTKNDCFGVLK
nr:MAG TPA: hypothetical protein [Bacteriophage sp.]